MQYIAIYLEAFNSSFGASLTFSLGGKSWKQDWPKKCNLSSFFSFEYNSYFLARRIFLDMVKNVQHFIFVILMYFHIQLFQIYLSAAEMEHRLISDPAFPQAWEIYLFNRIISTNSLSK